MNEDMMRDAKELFRRYAIAAIHDAGTNIRLAEVRRIVLPCNVLKMKCEALKEMGQKDILHTYGDIFLSGTEQLRLQGSDPLEAMKILFKQGEQWKKVDYFIEEVNSVCRDVNKIIRELKGAGLFFQFTRFQKILSPDQALLTLNEISGFLEGLIELGHTGSKE